MIIDPWHVWATIALVCLIFEVFVPGLIFGCLAIGAVGGCVGDFLGYGWEGQTLIASFTSIAAFIFVRPFAMKKCFSGAGVKTGVDALIGRTAEVTQAVDESSGFGRCKVDGDDWKMQLESSNELKVGAKVEIVAVESAVLIVKSK